MNPDPAVPSAPTVPPAAFAHPLPCEPRPTFQQHHSSSDNIIDLTPFDHSTPHSPRPPVSQPAPPEDDAFMKNAAEFMRRLVTIVPPAPSSSQVSSASVSISQPLARAATAPSSPAPRRRSLDEARAERDAAPAPGATSSWLKAPAVPDLGIGKWWAGGMGKQAQASPLDRRPSPLPSLEPEQLTLPSTPPNKPSSLLSNFPSFSPSQPSASPTAEVHSQLQEALSTSLDSPAALSTTSSSFATADLPTLFSQSTFTPPPPPTPPPRAVVHTHTPSKSARSSHSHPFLLPTSSPRHSPPSIGTTPAIAPYFRPRSNSLGLPPPSLARSETLSSIDTLRTLQTRGFATSQDWDFRAGPTWMKEHKQMMDQMLDEDDQGDSVEDQEEHIHQRHTPTKNPVVFCHGLFGFDLLGPASLPPLQISHWRGIREILEANGTEVFITRVPATSSIEERAKILEKTIAERYEGRAVNLVGHSMGGLDCRYLISHLKPTAFKVSSLTTIATPHRGSPFADHLINNIIGRTHLPQLLSLLDVLRLPHQGDGAAFEALSVPSMTTFNKSTPDDPSVAYFSWAAQVTPTYFNTWKWPHSVILPIEGANDGLVSVESAKWGEFMGTLDDVNHLDLVGWINPIRYTMAEWVGKSIKFKPASFYLEMADTLAARGF